jgi:hypothetical protein
MNGIYYSNDLETFHFVRFLPSNQVITVSVSNENNDSPSSVWNIISSWFDENYRSSRGRYSDFGGVLCWYVESEQGTVMYHGQKDENGLNVQIHSHINGHMSGVQRFRQLKFPD